MACLEPCAVDNWVTMDRSTTDSVSRARVHLGGVTLLLALALSVRVLDAAYVLPAFRPMVAHAATRLLAVSGSDATEHRPAINTRTGRVAARPKLGLPVAEPDSALLPAPRTLVCVHLLNLPPPTTA